MRTLAIDLGARRVGLAVSDAAGRLASALQVLTVGSFQEAIQRIIQIAQQHGAQRLVVGLPLNMDDSLGPAARQTLAWGRQLAAASALPVIYVDERLSSFEADQQLAQRRRQGEALTRGRKKQRRDALAAAVFLQAFLDGTLPAVEV